MLRITETRTPDGVTLRLEGKLLAAWVSELNDAFATASAGGPVGLDLRDLMFVDAEGTTALRNLIRQGATLSACSNFVSQVLGDLSHA